MWPFKSRPKAPRPKSHVEIVSEKYPVGREFNYLYGTKVIIVQNTAYTFSDFGPRAHVSLEGQYKDDNGVIREVALNYSLLEEMNS